MLLAIGEQTHNTITATMVAEKDETNRNGIRTRVFGLRAERLYDTYGQEPSVRDNCH